MSDADFLLHLEPAPALHPRPPTRGSHVCEADPQGSLALTPFPKCILTAPAPALREGWALGQLFCRTVCVICGQGNVPLWAILWEEGLLGAQQVTSGGAPLREACSRARGSRLGPRSPAEGGNSFCGTELCGTWRGSISFLSKEGEKAARYRGLRCLSGREKATQTHGELLCSSERFAARLRHEPEELKQHICPSCRGSTKQAPGLDPTVPLE